MNASVWQDNPTTVGTQAPPAPVVAPAKPNPCSALCDKVVGCAELKSTSLQQQTLACTKSCEEQVAASTARAEHADAVVARCKAVSSCDELATCIKKVPIRSVADMLRLPIADETAQRWVSLTCELVKQHPGRMMELKSSSEPLPQVIELNRLEAGIAAADPAAMAELTEQAWTQCGKALE